MHNNYYFLRKLSASLDSKLKDYQIGEIFSQNKNELIFSFYSKEDDFFVKAFLDPSFCCLSFPGSFQRAKKNSINLFEELVDLKVLNILPTAYDRSFKICLEHDYTLFFKMYGNRSNIILFQKDQYQSQFNHKLKSDHELVLRDREDIPKISFERFKELNGDYKTLNPVLGKSADPFFEQKGYLNRSIKEQWSILNDFLAMLEDPEYYISEDQQGLPVLRLYHHSPVKKTLKDPIQALNFFYSTYIKQLYVIKQKQALSSKMSAIIKKNENYRSKAIKKLNHLLERPKYKQIADIIMANIQNIPKGAKEVRLFNFYSNQEINISLKPNLSPQINAGQYYKKAKNESIEIEILNANIRNREKEINKLKQELKDLESYTTAKPLNEMSGKLIKSSRRKEEKYDPFILFNLLDFDILVGKNDRTNDLLTFKTAKKNDLWLHVKDAPGSHVVVRQKPGTNFPKRVIERAAELAAFHSKRKNETVCPVSYTEKKFVRKAKGLKAGEVIVEKERVLLVKPQP